MVSEAFLKAVDVRCHTRRLSFVRIDLARRTDDSGSVEFCASRRVYEEQATIVMVGAVDMVAHMGVAAVGARGRSALQDG